MKPVSWLCGLLLALHAWSQDGVPAPFADADAVEVSSDEPTHFDPDLLRPKFVQVQVEWVEMTHEQLTELMFESNPPTSDATPLRKKVAELVKQEKAKVLETAMVVARSGEKGTTESNCEFIYPTEYSLPRIWEPFDAESSDGSEANQTERTTSSFSVFGSPTAFETRNLGTMIEVAPNIGAEDKVIDLNIEPSLVWHTGDTLWAEIKDGLGNTNRVEMPQIYALQINTAITCMDGHYTLIAIQSPKDQAGRADFSRKVMVFVRCDIKVVKESD